MKEYLKLIRVKHWIKNLLIFLPLFFNKSVNDIDKFIGVIFGFFAFSLMASCIYIINDIKDLEKDKKHPVKRSRPIASGKISVSKAILGFCVNFTLSIILLIIGFLYFDINLVNSLIYLLSYFILNVAYSMGLKQQKIVDVTIVALGFVLRVLFGGAIVNVEISSWLFLTIFSIAFYLGLSKRNTEFVKHKDIDTREVLKFYNADFFSRSMSMCLSLAIGFYALWAKDYENKIILWSVPLIMVMCMRYVLDVEDKESEGDPTDIILNDKVLILLGIVYLVLMYFGLYN